MLTAGTSVLAMIAAAAVANLRFVDSSALLSRHLDVDHRDRCVAVWSTAGDAA